MLTEHHEEHRVYVTEGETWVDHGGCPRWPQGEDCSWLACYVGAVAEGEEEPGWQELIDSLEPGVHLITTVIAQRPYTPDDPLVTHTVEKWFASTTAGHFAALNGELQLMLRRVASPLVRLLERLRRKDRQR